MKRILISISVIFLLFIFSCKKTFERKDTLIVLLSKSIKNISPLTAKGFDELAISNLIARGLFFYDIKSRQIKNEIAEKYTVSTCGKIWTFTIKKDIEFSNGEKLDAQVIVQNFEEFLKKSPKKIYYENIKSIIKVNELEIIINLKKPDYEFIVLLSGRNRLGFMSLKEQNKIIGYGPYIIASISNETIVLERNRNYKESPVETEKIIFKTVLSESERLHMIYNRLADIATINDISNINEINNRTFLRSIKKLNSSKIIAVAGREPFNNQNIINAILGFSLIRNKIAYSVFNEYAQTEINILPSYSLYYRKLEHIFFYNPDEVKNHIKKTGVEKINFVLDLPINITRFNRGIDHWKNELSKFDIKMKVNKEQQESIINKINKNDFQAALIVVDDFMIHPRDILIFYETFSSDDAKKRLLPDETLNYINNAITINNVARRNLNYFRAFENFAQNSRILGVITLPSYYLTTDNVQNIDDLLIGKFDKVRVYR